MTGILYDSIGVGYATRRRADPRIYARIDAALAECNRVVNVGAGAGSYEPANRAVIAVEPSTEMIKQRSPFAAPVVQAWANRLPFRNQSFDASLAILTVHHWSHREQGLAELRRVARERVVLLTYDTEHSNFWLSEQYFPEIAAMDRPAFPTLSEIETIIGPAISTIVPIPADCCDGFLGAYWQRPEKYLDPEVRAAISVFSKFETTAGLARLKRDLEDGTWLAANGALKNQEELDVGYRVVVAQCGESSK